MKNDGVQLASIRKLVAVPALITLGVTLLRLTGELLNWSPALFNRSAGGGGSLVGIIWLVPVFGAYFALKLVREGEAPESVGRMTAFSLAGLIAFLVVGGAGFAQPVASLPQFALIGAGSALAMALAYRGWRAHGALLLAYGLAARIPVAVIVLLAILGDWRTHYDVPPPGLPVLGSFARWIAIGFIPQLTIWMAATLVFGSLSGAAALAVTRNRARSAEAAL